MSFLRRLSFWQRLHHPPAVLWGHLEGRGKLERSIRLPLPSGVGGARQVSSSGFFSWVDKVKDMLNAGRTPEAKAEYRRKKYTLLSCADDLKKSGPPLNPMLDKATAIRLWEKENAILTALARHDPTGDNLDVKQKTEVAVQFDSSIQRVNMLLAKYKYMRDAYVKILQRKDEGITPPTTAQEMQELMGGPFMPYANAVKSGDIGRNSLCHCGSGKKYKRCCGRV